MQERLKKLMIYFLSVPFYFKLQKKYNDLETKYEMLLNNTKDRFFENYLNAVNANVSVERIQVETQLLNQRKKDFKKLKKTVILKNKKEGEN